MQPNNDHKGLLSEVIKKQIVILGPDITLAKARNVPGLSVADDGSVTQIQGDPQVITQKLVEQFMELSGLIVKKTMEPLLAMGAQMSVPPAPVAPVQPVQTSPMNTPQPTPPAQQQVVTQPASS